MEEPNHLDQVSPDALLECSVAILNFLLEPENLAQELNSFETPGNKTLCRVMDKYHTNMCDFTVYMNKQFNIYYDDNNVLPLWILSAKEFFSKKESSVSFYMHIINKLYKNRYESSYNSLFTGKKKYKSMLKFSAK